MIAVETEEMDAGERKILRFVIDPAESDPIDLTTVTLSWSMQVNATTLLTKTPTAIDASTAEVELVEADTANLAEATYEHILWATSGTADSVLARHQLTVHETFGRP